MPPCCCCCWTMYDKSSASTPMSPGLRSCPSGGSSVGKKTPTPILVSTRTFGPVARAGGPAPGCSPPGCSAPAQVPKSTGAGMESQLSGCSDTIFSPGVLTPGHKVPPSQEGIAIGSGRWQEPMSADQLSRELSTGLVRSRACGRIGVQRRPAACVAPGHTPCPALPVDYVVRLRSRKRRASQTVGRPGSRGALAASGASWGERTSCA